MIVVVVFFCIAKGQCIGHCAAHFGQAGGCWFACVYMCVLCVYALALTMSREVRIDRIGLVESSTVPAKSEAEGMHAR